MKHAKLLLCAAAWGCLLCAAGAVEVGDTREQVLAELGSPKGQIRIEANELLYFPRGTVKLRDGIVTEVSLVTPEEAATLEAEAAKQAQRRRLAEAQRRAQLQAEGEAERARLLHDEHFLRSSAANQVAVWQRFLRRYPDVDVSAYYTDALERYRAEQEREERQQRLADLEFRTHMAEKRAAEAEQAARDARSYSYAYPYPYVVYPYPTGYGRRGARGYRGPVRDEGLQIRYQQPGLSIDYRAPSTRWVQPKPLMPTFNNPSTTPMPIPAPGTSPLGGAAPGAGW